jgi:RNA polymerase sigma-70 factor, ECF subfamily
MFASVQGAGTCRLAFFFGKIAPVERLQQVPESTLGDVLYSGGRKGAAPEAEWFGLVQRMAAGEQAALHALFARSNRIVFTLALRITANPQTAEELTLDVFHDCWRRAPLYDPANGTVLGWIMNQARSRALDRVRFDKRKKRVDPGTEDAEPGHAADAHDLLEATERATRLHAALGVLTPDERSAIEAAFFSELTHAEAAQRLKQPLGTVKTRIRSGLQKLRQALADGKTKS